ncbi:hypothetical protein I316_07255 [Kwoniella heveanensis BCC8398]|uniref:Guanyl nucleotide exchange factor Sql2 n=1 Tax=Kwoniella heveanensis BCC8398 TaxID=1296120 RepID=A0A1B9GJI0_9TREE|nr:hypothetical protein I316_07255 [Kwoniella heveanensis BCC8398]
MIQHKSIPSTSSYHSRAQSQSEAGPSTQHAQAPPTPISPPITSRQPTHVQAIHDFDPSLLASTSSSSSGMYLSFKAGEIIRVHVRDATGWWDGEISGTTRWATEGEDSTVRGLRRGWFPSNYVREMGWDGTLHRRTESASKSGSASSPTIQRTESMPGHSTHSRQTSAASHHSRTSTATSISQVITSPTRAEPASLPVAFQTLMHPIVQSLSLLESAIHSNRKAHIQPSTACVISSIRAALMQTDCLSKESSTLVTWPVLAKERKIVLVELSKLVACARTASGAAETEGADDSKELEALAKAARGVFASVKRFLHLAHSCGVEVTLMDSAQDPGLEASLGGQSDAASQVTSDLQDSSNQSTIGRSSVRTPTSGNARIQETFRLKAASIGDLRAARRRAASPPPPLPSAAVTPSTSRSGRARSPSFASTPMSATFSAGSDRSSPVVMKSYHDRRMVGSMDSAFTHVSTASSEDMQPSWEDPTPIPTPQATTASRQLGAVADVHEAISHAEDALLSIIAAFIGHIHSHHIGSHPSSHANLIEMTRETIDSVRELLTIVEAVGRNVGVRHKRPREIESLRIAKDQLYDVASKVVESAEVVANAPFSEFGEESYDVEKARLLQAATGTLRAGTECVRLVKLCLPEDDNVHLNATPRQGDVSGRQSTPRPAHAHEAPLTLREKPVGARGVHTLSGLHRKATSLSTLQRRYQQDGSINQAPVEEDEEDEEADEEEEDQEIVQDYNKDEDLTMRPTVQPTLGTLGTPVSFPTRPSLQHNHTSPGQIFTARRPSEELLRALGQNDISGPRSRSSSLTSPAPPRIQHRSPSRSADLDKFTGDYDFTMPPQRRASRGTISTSSRLSMYTSASSHASATSTAPTSIRSSDMSDYGGQHPHAHDESTTVYAPLKVDIPSSNYELSRLADLKLEEATPIKAYNHLRPAAPVRSNTAPMPAASGDARFWVVAHDYDPGEIAFNSEGAMVGASLPVLVEKMTPHDGPVDLTFNATFFFTFRLYTTPTKLLETVMARYDLQPPGSMILGEKERALWIERKVVPVRLRIYNFLKAWLEQHWRPDTDDVVLETMETFARDVVTVTLPAMGPRLHDLIRRKLNGPSSARSDRSSFQTGFSMDRLRGSAQSGMLHPPPISGGLPPTPVISKNLHSLLQKAATAGSNVNITEFDTVELARQFTIMESKMFGAVLPEDLLQTGKKTIPELKALSTLSNQITGWVADSILNETDAKKRASLVKFFIKLADKCLILYNFSTMFAVLAGLNSSTILRLKKTWDALPTKYRITIERLRGVIEHTKNHAAYRARLREAPTPCLPFLGLILTDITFTADGNPNTRPSVLAPEINLINQDKYNKLGRIAMDFKRYQEPFNFHEIAAVQNFLRRVLTERGSGSVDALYRKSLMLEPRQGSERFSSNVERPNWLSGKI